VATPADAESLAALARRLGAIPLPHWRTPDEISAADAREMIAALTSSSTDNEVFIAERDGHVVGCLHMLATTDFFGRPHAHISVIATTEDAEGTGVGRAMLARAEAWARDKGMSLLTLNVFDGNARARRFYESAGFAAETLKYTKPV
jgi:GNAT superfamily N-acetyltransferase